MNHYNLLSQLGSHSHQPTTTVKGVVTVNSKPVTCSLPITPPLAYEANDVEWGSGWRAFLRAQDMLLYVGIT